MHRTFRAQVRPGYESDRYRLMVYSRPTSEIANLTEKFDRWVSEVAWSPDSSHLFFTAEDRGRGPIFTVPARGGGLTSVVFGDAYHGDIQLTPDGRSIVYSVQSASHPTEIFLGFASGGPPVPLTRFNDALMSAYTIDSPEEISYESIDGTTIHGFLVKPPGFDFERTYPLLLLIHGGPQGSWGQKWSYRWNPQVFAGAGYVVFMPNPRGSTGYGQTLTDAINGDWGGLVYEDIMAGLDYVLRRPYVDSEKLTAAGASYGGDMIKWMVRPRGRFRAPGYVNAGGVNLVPVMCVIDSGRLSGPRRPRLREPAAEHVSDERRVLPDPAGERARSGRGLRDVGRARSRGRQWRSADVLRRCHQPAESPGGKRAGDL